VSGDKDKQDADGEEEKEGKHACAISTMERVVVPSPAHMQPVHPQCVLHREKRPVDIDFKAADAPHLHVPSSSSLYASLMPPRLGSPYPNASQAPVSPLQAPRHHGLCRSPARGVRTVEREGGAG
jgi:hypothetical protein